MLTGPIPPTEKRLIKARCLDFPRHRRVPGERGFAPGSSWPGSPQPAPDPDLLHPLGGAIAAVAPPLGASGAGPDTRMHITCATTGFGTVATMCEGRGTATHNRRTRCLTWDSCVETSSAEDPRRSGSSPAISSRRRRYHPPTRSVRSAGGCHVTSFKQMVRSDARGGCAIPEENRGCRHARLPLQTSCFRRKARPGAGDASTSAPTRVIPAVLPSHANNSKRKGAGSPSWPTERCSPVAMYRPYGSEDLAGIFARLR